jgi:hypothetical protein
LALWKNCIGPDILPQSAFTVFRALLPSNVKAPIVEERKHSIFFKALWVQATLRSTSALVPFQIFNILEVLKHSGKFSSVVPSWGNEERSFSSA